MSFLVEYKEFWSIVFFVVGLILMILEMGIPTNFQLFAFGMGFLGLSVMTFFGINVLIQVFVFAIIVIATISIAHIFTSKTTVGSKDFSPYDLIGKKGKVVKIENDKVIVKVEGEEWLAESDDMLKTGDKIIVSGVKGVKVIVSKMEI